MAMTMRRTRHKLEPKCVHKESSTDKRNSNNSEETLQTNKQTALTNLQLVYSCVFTCFRFAATLNMLLCLSLCIVSLIQSSSVFPRIHFSPVCEFLVIVHNAKTGLLRCCLCTYTSSFACAPRLSRFIQASVIHSGRTRQVHTILGLHPSVSV